MSYSLPGDRGVWLTSWMLGSAVRTRRLEALRVSATDVVTHRRLCCRRMHLSSLLVAADGAIAHSANVAGNIARMAIHWASNGATIKRCARTLSLSLSARFAMPRLLN